MSKNLWRTLIILGGVLAAAFLTILLLSLPLGGKASVLSTFVFCIVGGVIAGVFLLAALFFFLRTRKRG